MKKYFFITLFMLCSLSVGHAFELTPMEKEFSSSGVRSNQTFFVENKSSKPVALEINMFRRTHGANGVEQRTATDDFFIFPRALQLKAQEKRAIRVTWQGAKSVDQELAYRLVAEQISVDVDKTTNKNIDIKYLLKFIASVYVTPDSSKPEVSVKGVLSKNGRLHVFLQNKGKKHKILNTSRLMVRTGSGVKELPPKFTEVLQRQNILASSTQYFSVPTPRGWTGPYSGELKSN
ncbi:MAG: fimbria/pilus periplasmic chaperone [Pseudomonadota bacterium]|nr:fimbria/pilus periplasmic chaperone [Pseudomonadota bacterium]